MLKSPVSQPRFSTEQDLKDFFFDNLRNPNPVSLKRAAAGVMVNSSLRRKVLTGEGQGEFIIEGRVRRFEFKSLGGGVWQCNLSGDKPPN